MHVGLNLAFLIPGENGGRETYARELAMALADARPDWRFTSFLGQAAEQDRPWSDIGRIVRLPTSASSRLQWAWAEVAGVPAAATRARVDLLHSLANFGAIAGPFARVLTLHDLLYRTHPQLLTPAMRRGTAVLLPPAARRAHRILTVSRVSCDEIVSQLGIPLERIDVIPNGVGEPRWGNADAARARLRAGRRQLVLSVAADLPHKNLDALLAGLAQLNAGKRPLLALAGKGTAGPRLRERTRELALEADTRLLGAVDAAELEDLYAAADLLITATRHEGFGIPLIEAMARGVLVACSDLPVLREVAGDAAAWFEPDRPEEVARAIRRLAAGGSETDRMRRAGIQRALRFSWKAAAAATAESYERALSARSRR